MYTGTESPGCGSKKTKKNMKHITILLLCVTVWDHNYAVDPDEPEEQ